MAQEKATNPLVDAFDFLGIAIGLLVSRTGRGGVMGVGQDRADLAQVKTPSVVSEDFSSPG